jgi:hypothetical protein
VQERTTCPRQFGVCTDNTGYPASLEVGKLYRLVPDADAAKHGYLRVVDESGEDYAYSASRFYVLRIPAALEKRLKFRATAEVRRRVHA